MEGGVVSTAAHVFSIVVLGLVFGVMPVLAYVERVRSCKSRVRSEPDMKTKPLTGDLPMIERRQVFPTDVRTRVLLSPPRLEELNKRKQNARILRFPDGKLLRRKQRKSAARKK